MPGLCTRKCGLGSRMCQLSSEYGTSVRWKNFHPASPSTVTGRVLRPFEQPLRKPGVIRIRKIQTPELRQRCKIRTIMISVPAPTDLPAAQTPNFPQRMVAPDEPQIRNACVSLFDSPNVHQPDLARPGSPAQFAKSGLPKREGLLT